jgi:hypothetical protein
VANDLPLSRKRIRHWAEPYKSYPLESNDRYAAKNNRRREVKSKAGSGGGRQTKTP